MKKTSFNYSIEPWLTKGINTEYTTKIFKVLSKEMKLESEGITATFSVLEAPDWINVIPLTPEREIVLVEQYRYGIDLPTLELPGGMCDPGEDPLETSKRETLEETGYASEEWISLGKVSSNPAIMDNYTHTFLALNCHKVKEQQLDGNERINVHTMPLEEFLEMVHQGEVTHSLVVAAVARFLLSDHA